MDGGHHRPSAARAPQRGAARAGAGRSAQDRAAARPSQIDAYLPFIRQTLETFPTLTASRLYGMARERGYRGSPDHFRRKRCGVPT